MDLANSDIVRLASGALSLDLRPALGGSISAFRWRHPSGVTFDVLRPGPKYVSGPQDVEAMSCFPLTPFSNRLRAGRCSFGGHDIRMPLNTDGPHVEHGHGWQRPWTVLSAGPDDAVLALTHVGDAWPFPYEARQHFRLLDDRLDVEFRVRNTGTEAMPYGFGLHPYFVRTPRCTMTASVPGFWETDADVMPVRLVGTPADIDPAKGLRIAGHALDNVFTGWDGVATVRWPERSAEVVMTADAPLRFLVVYSPAGESYFCAEPVSNATDAFNLANTGRTDTGMIVLEPNAEISARVSFLPRAVKP